MTHESILLVEGAISLAPFLVGAMLFRIKGLRIKEIPGNVKSKLQNDGTTVVLVPTGEHAVLTMLARGEERFSLGVEDFKKDRFKNTGYGNTVITIKNPEGAIVKKHNINEVGVEKEISHGVSGTYYPTTQEVPENFHSQPLIVFPVKVESEPALS